MILTFVTFLCPITIFTAKNIIEMNITKNKSTDRICIVMEFDG